MKYDEADKLTWLVSTAADDWFCLMFQNLMFDSVVDIVGDN